MSDSTFNFLIDQDVKLVSSIFTNGTLYSYIDEKNLRFQTGKERYLLDFEITGYLKKGTSKCSHHKFVVSQIRYGNEINFLKL